MNYKNESNRLKMKNLSIKSSFELQDLINNGTTHINILTSKNWKCKRKGCKTDYKHSHSTYV